MVVGIKDKASDSGIRCGFYIIWLILLPYSQSDTFTDFIIKSKIPVKTPVLLLKRNGFSFI